MSHSSALLLLACCPSAFAQTPLYTVYGDADQDLLGYSVSGAGDVDGDGVPDQIAGAFQADNNGTDSGSAWVLSGVDGSTLYRFDGEAHQDFFGHSVSGAGDVNADGYADLIVGAYLSDAGASVGGMARVFSGRDGSILYTFVGSGTGDHLGFSVSGAGDVNGDGFDDVIAGAEGDDTIRWKAGAAHVYSGADGSTLYSFYGDGEEFYFGFTVSEAGDVNLDGFDDVMVGAQSDDGEYEATTVRVFSGADGSILYEFHGFDPGDWFGYAMDTAGDVDADGYPDLIIGTPQYHKVGFGSGRATVFSGFDGSTLRELYGVAYQGGFGFSVSGAGDLDGDGHADVIVGAPYDGEGAAIVFSGATGDVLSRFSATTALSFTGISVDAAGDVNGDGVDDQVVGAANAERNGIYGGAAFVLSVCGLGARYCSPALPNSTGRAGVIVACGSERVADENFQLSAFDLPPGQFGFFLTSRTQGFFQPPGSLGILCLSGNIGRFDEADELLQGPSAIRTIDLSSFPVSPPVAVQPGETWNFQCWFRDVGATSNFTDRSPSRSRRANANPERPLALARARMGAGRRGEEGRALRARTSWP
ncbi:MAG: hypothetical protein GY711_12905 [bacterium]|nr:hypothetical protein [bacterium]